MTTDPRSVRFLVAEGDRFTLEPGMEKPLLEFASVDHDHGVDTPSRLVLAVVLPKDIDVSHDANPLASRTASSPSDHP